MKNIVALDIETKDPSIFSGHGYLQEGFEFLDCGASYFDENGVLTSTSFEFLHDPKKGMEELLSFLRKHDFDKIIFHNIWYDLPILQHYGMPLREFYKNGEGFGDTMNHSTALEPFRSFNNLKSLCYEYDVPVKKISDEEMVEDISRELSKEFQAQDAEEIQSYVKKTYNIDLKKIKSHLLELKEHFPSVYKDYLTADTEATLLLYHILESEVDKVCIDFDTNLSSITGRNLRDVIKTEEAGIIPNIIMSTTPIALDWDKVEQEAADYEVNIAELKNKYKLFFHPDISIIERVDPDASSLENIRLRVAGDSYIEVVLSKDDILKIIEDKKEELTNIYPNMFQKEIELMDYVAMLDDTKIMLDALRQSFLFQEINSVDEANFKAIVDRYRGDILVQDKFLKKDGSLSTGKKAVKNLMSRKDLPEELKLVFQISKEFKKTSTNYTKFIKPFLEAKEKKGGLYTQLYAYRTSQQKTFLSTSEEKVNGTATGRESSSNFNLQNIPRSKGDAYNTRGKFIARKSEFAKKIPNPEVAYFAVDYKDQEGRSATIQSKSKAGLKMFREEEDADRHKTTAGLVLVHDYKKTEKTQINIRRTTEEENKKGVESSVTEEFEPVHTLNVVVADEQRSKAKAVNFGILYFQSARELGISLKISTEEAKDMIKAVTDIHPEYLEFYRQCIRTFKEFGYIANMFGRIYKPYNMKPFLAHIDLDDFAEFIELGEHLSMAQKNHIMRKKVVVVREAIKDRLWHLPSKVFYEKLTKTPEYKIAKPLKPYEWYVDTYKNAKKDIYEKGEFSEIVFLMVKKKLFYTDTDRNIRDIIALHAKMIFKDGNYKNWDYVKECKTLRGQEILDSEGNPEKFAFKSSIVALRGDIDNWDGTEDMFQVSKFIWSWAWHICNCTIGYIFNFLKKIVNAMCQGAGADLMKIVKANLWRDGITDPESPNFLFDMHFPVHDAFEGTVLVEKIEEVKKVIKKYMELAFDGVIMSVDIEIGETWK